MSANKYLSTAELIAKHAIEEYIDPERLIDCVLNVVTKNKIITTEPLHVSRETIEQAIKIAYKNIQPDVLTTMPHGLMYKKLNEYAKSTGKSN